jgi:quinol-cytochrome oxidoreductase complex cytochrome b subunit
VRILRFFIQGVYRPPRELMWVFAALLLLVCFHLDLTGRALPMTETAYWSSVRALEVVKAVPVYGSLMIFLTGGGELFVSDLTLLRFYVLHAAIFPALAVVLIYLHFSTIRRIGLTEASGDRKRVGRAALRNHLVNLAIILTLLFALLVTLAVLTPLPFQREADPYATVPGVGPPWYLLAPFGFLEITSGVVPQWVAGLVLFLGFSAFLALPFLDRSREAPHRRWMVPTIAVLIVVAWVLLTMYGARVA